MTQPHCPTCGAAVIVVSSTTDGHGSTNYYRPVDQTARVERLERLLASLSWDVLREIADAANPHNAGSRLSDTDTRCALTGCVNLARHGLEQLAAAGFPTEPAATKELTE